MLVSKYHSHLKLTLVILLIVLFISILFIVIQFNYYDKFYDLFNGPESNQDSLSETTTNRITTNVTEPGGQVGDIVGGSNADPDFWHFLVSVAVKGIPLCGGSLITDHHVLTAAHCFFDKKTNRMVEPGSVLVVIGTHKIYDVDGFTKHVSAQQIYFTNPPFNMTSHQNDIAIIKLKEKIDFTKKASTISLPETTGHNYKTDSDGNLVARVAGWGRISDKKLAKASDDLLETRLQLTSLSECNEAYQKIARPFAITEQQLCTKTPNDSAIATDACHGDSGGPLIQLDTDINEYILTGVISFGKGCANPNFPGVYAKVEYFLDWIRNKLQN